MEEFLYTRTCNSCGKTKLLALMSRSHGRPMPTCSNCKSDQSRRWAVKNLAAGKVKSGIEKHPWGPTTKRKR